MQYLSTRDKSLRVSAAEAIKMGLSRDGGLFTPVNFPVLRALDVEMLRGMSYPRRAAYIMGKYLEQFRPEDLGLFAERAYGPDRFDAPGVAPLRQLDQRTWCLELWHGPTSAFKDMALQMLPQLLSTSLRMTGEEKTACILAATSGDTGKAAMEGFADVEQTRILVFYPRDGVSEIQRLQMVTQEGDNVGVCAVEGNFDDAQNGVKRIFSDPAIREELEKRGCFLSSANSINWGRILPQVVYYISAYCDLLNAKEIKLGDKVNYCVPTGNFGSILACYYARRMGLPVGKLICASNRNDVLTEFIRTGVYDRNRPFHATMSPSMDILISSNLERLLFSLTQDTEEVKGYMARLSETGRYQVSDRIRDRLQKRFKGYFCDDKETQRVIRSMYDRHGYLIDTHTAVAFSALEKYRAETGDGAPAIVASTASPFKFCGSVLEALGETTIASGLDALDQLTERTGQPAPAPLAGLRDKKVRFTQVVEKENMADAVRSLLE